MPSADVTALLASIARNPFDPMAMGCTWIVLTLFGLAVRRFIRRFYPLEFAIWWYMSVGAMAWTLVIFRNLDNRGDVAKQMETPVLSVMLGTLSYVIMSLIWPLLWLFFTTWFSRVPEMMTLLLSEMTIAQAVGLTLGLLATVLLRQTDQRSAARQKRLDQG